MVIAPAIGSADCVHAWLLRGWVEAGVPDATLGGAVPEGGAFNAENLRFNGGVEGLALCFPGFEPGEEWVYRVVVAGGAGGAVHVVCPDTLFMHAYAGISPPQLGVRILTDVCAHNEAFVAWRAQGGQAGLGEQRALQAPRGIAASRALLDFAERRYRAGQSLAEGPANAWWLVDMAPNQLGSAITTGSGVDPMYRLKGEAPVSDRPENREYAAAIRTLGSWLIGLSVAAMIAAGLTLTWAGYNVFIQRADILLSKDLAGLKSFGDLMSTQAAPLGGFITSAIFSACWLVAGLRIRSLANLTLVRVLLGISVLPCSGVCCLVGAPMGGWVLYRLADPKAKLVFRGAR